MQMVSYSGKTYHYFHLVVMCADAWDSEDLSAVTYGTAGEMEDSAYLPISHLLLGAAPSDLNHYRLIYRSAVNKW